MKSDPRVLFVQPDSTAVAFEQTIPTGVNRIDGDARSSTSKARIDGIDDRVDANVAVIDTGINSTHPDLNVTGDATSPPSFPLTTTMTMATVTAPTWPERSPS